VVYFDLVDLLSGVSCSFVDQSEQIVRSSGNGIVEIEEEVLFVLSMEGNVVQSFPLSSCKVY